MTPKVINTKSPTLDIDGTLARLKGDTDFLHTLFGVFADDLPKKISALDDAMANRDVESAHRTAHSLKGASATVGALALREIAFALEQAAKSGDMDKTGELLVYLKVKADSTLDEVNRYITA